MPLFRCRACEAKDSEIAHLISQLDRLSALVERAQARLVELERPGTERSVRAAERGSPRRPERTPQILVPGFPGYRPEVKGPAYVVDEPDEGA